MQAAKFIVAALGLKNTETSLLKTFLNLHSGRSWNYELQDGINENVAAPHIWVVDMDDPMSAGLWGSIRGTIRSSVCVGVYSKQRPAGEPVEEFAFYRPLRMSYLIKTLDEIVLKRLGFRPPISDNAVVLESESAPVPGQDVGPPSGIKGYRALVVDDSPTIRIQMTSLLRELGFVVNTADSSDTALKLLSDPRYDIIFLDVIMPGAMDGYKLCKLCKAHGQFKDTPVMLLTSKDSVVDKVRGKLSGADAYLTKPINQRELVAAMGRFLTLRVPALR